MKFDRSCLSIYYQVLTISLLCISQIPPFPPSLPLNPIQYPFLWVDVSSLLTHFPPHPLQTFLHLTIKWLKKIYIYTHTHIYLYIYYVYILEKAMAPHSSTLAWKIPWTEEPGKLQSMGLQRVGHNCATSLSLFTFMQWRRKWQPTPVFLPGESQGRGSLVGCRLWGHKRVRHNWLSLQPSVFMSNLISQCIPPCLPHLVSTHLFSMSASLFRPWI